MTAGYSKAEILHELAAILASREFIHAERLSAFLSYVVRNSIEGPREGLKESVIGTEVFGRPPGYDPKAEPIVRTEARRLRARMEEYYSHQDRWYRVRISIPKGSYAAIFEEGNRPAVAAAVPAVTAAPAVEVIEAPPPPASSAPSRWLVWSAVGILLASACLLALRLLPARSRPQPILTTLTSYPGVQEYPALSPDGTEVAFAWSSDEHPIAHIYVAPVRGGGDPQPISTGPSADSFPEWSPDGSQIAFIRENRWLTLMARRGGGERRLGEGYKANVSWSPDGRWIVHSGWTDDHGHIALFETDPVTGRTRQLTFPKDENGVDAGAAFSPDGRRLAFIRCTSGGSVCGAYTMPPAGGTPETIATALGVTTGLTWTPDGRAVLITSRRVGWSQLWLVDAFGSGRIEVVPAAGDDVHWAKLGRGPNGRVVYEQHQRDSNIWALEAGSGTGAKFGEARRVIASTRIDSSPQFSPDGRSIVFVSNRSGYDELWRADADGIHESALTNLRMQSLGSPRWSPDGTRIAFDATSSGGPGALRDRRRGGNSAPMDEGQRLRAPELVPRPPLPLLHGYRRQWHRADLEDLRRRGAAAAPADDRGWRH